MSLTEVASSEPAESATARARGAHKCESRSKSTLYKHGVARRPASRNSTATPAPRSGTRYPPKRARVSGPAGQSDPTNNLSAFRRDLSVAAVTGAREADRGCCREDRFCAPHTPTTSSTSSPSSARAFAPSRTEAREGTPRARSSATMCEPTSTAAPVTRSGVIERRRSSSGERWRSGGRRSSGRSDP